MPKPQKYDIDFEIQFYEKILKRKPDFIEALAALGNLYSKKGLYREGLEIDKRLVHLRPEDSLAFYNLACSYSLVKDLDKAFGTIKQAIDLGYNNFSYLEQDQDLTNLRHDQRFQEYYLGLKKQKV